MKRRIWAVMLLVTVGCGEESTKPGTGKSPANREAGTVAKADPKTAPSTHRTGPQYPLNVAKEDKKDTPMPPPPKPDVEPEEPKPEKDPPIPDSFKPLNKNRTIFFEKDAAGVRRVHLLAEVCLREGHLEVFLCKSMTKEHESILRVDADAREIHTALTLAGAEAGSPVKFLPQYQPARGTAIKVAVTYHLNGGLKTHAAQEWVRDIKTRKSLAHEWVFAGSRLLSDPDDPQRPPYYTANNGEVISLSNFLDSMMDLPVNSPREAADLIFEINTALIPPRMTKVLVTLEPKLPKK